jgi:hypothetical protein
MINKHENISVGVYLDDISILGWKLSGLINTQGQQSVLILQKVEAKYSPCGTISR